MTSDTIPSDTMTTNTLLSYLHRRPNQKPLLVVVSIMVSLFLFGCASPCVVGIATTDKYLSGVYDVTDTHVWGVGTLPGPCGSAVVGYSHVLVRTIVTGAVYETTMRMKECEVIGRQP